MEENYKLFPEAFTVEELVNELKGRKRDVKKIFTPEQVMPWVAEWLEDDQENFIVITLDGAHHVIMTHLITKGLANRTLIHPREVFRRAIMDNAAAIITAHNHPSGNLEPSNEDKEIFTRINQAGEIIGINVLDHMVVSSTGYYSLLEKGRM